MDFEAEGYSHVRTLPGGTVVGLMPMLFTVGLCVGLDATGYRYRYCYPNMAEAVRAIEVWDGTNDPPGPWIKLKGHPQGDRTGPGFEFKGIPVNHVRS